MDERFTYNRRAPKLIKQAVNACTSVPPEEEQREREKKKREQRESRKAENKSGIGVVLDVTLSSVFSNL
jgi:hypothetical protein